MRKILFAILATLLMTACNDSTKMLVLYYSQTGTTKSVAEEIQKQTGADIASFDVVEVYDGTYDETIQRFIEERDKGFVPTLAELSCKVEDYDVIFLGYPIWFGTYAPPVKALLNTLRLEGKKIVPFCTFGSGGLQNSMEDLKKALPECSVENGYGVRSARLDAVEGELNRFLIENGWKKGEVEPLMEFSAPSDVNEEDVKIFNAACSGYKYPLGTPKSVCVRDIPDGKEYLFTAEGETPDGNKVESEIFVTVLSGKEPEFTQVVR